MQRRRFVSAIPTLLAGFSIAQAGRARAADGAGSKDPIAPAETAPTATPLGDKLWLLSGYGGNVTLFDSPDGVLLVDGGSASHSKRLLQQITHLAGTQRVHTLFNTHWHHDQVGLNATLGKAGTRIIAHEYTRLWLTTDVDSAWEQRVYQPLPKVALPNQTFYTKASIAFGGEQIDYGHLGQAHTDGDIYVFFRRANVLVAGDVVAVGRFPIIDPASNGWIGGLAMAADALMELTNESTKIVPGVGPAQTRTHLKAEQEMLNAMRLKLARLIAQGRSADEMIAARPAAEFEAAWGDPTQFIRNAYPGMAHRARDLGVSIV
jgi:cyclase